MLTRALIVMIAGIISAESADNPQAFLYGVCTVHNRIERGWTPENVMEQYYAPSIPAESWEISVTNVVLNSPNDCPEVYFMYSAEDINYLFSSVEEHSRICDRAGKCNVFLTIEQFRAAEYR